MPRSRGPVNPPVVPAGELPRGIRINLVAPSVPVEAVPASARGVEGAETGKRYRVWRVAVFARDMRVRRGAVGGSRQIM